MISTMPPPSRSNRPSSWGTPPSLSPLSVLNSLLLRHDSDDEPVRDEVARERDTSFEMPSLPVSDDDDAA